MSVTKLQITLYLRLFAICKFFKEKQMIKGIKLLIFVLVKFCKLKTIKWVVSNLQDKKIIHVHGQHRTSAFALRSVCLRFLRPPTKNIYAAQFNRLESFQS